MNKNSKVVQKNQLFILMAIFALFPFYLNPEASAKTTTSSEHPGSGHVSNQNDDFPLHAVSHEPESRNDNFRKAGAEMASESEVLQSLIKKFANKAVFRADMSHYFTDSYTDEVTSSFGTIWLGSYFYKIDTPDQVIVVDGETSTVFNKRQNKVILSYYFPEDDEFAPSRFFANTNEKYESSDFANSDGTTTILILSDDPFEMFKEVRIRVGRDGLPLEINAIDQMDNDMRTTFRFGRFESFDERVFNLSFPSEAEVVDLRD